MDSELPLDGEDFFSADMAFLRADPVLLTAFEERMSEVPRAPEDIS